MQRAVRRSVNENAIWSFPRGGTTSDVLVGRRIFNVSRRRGAASSAASAGGGLPGGSLLYRAANRLTLFLRTAAAVDFPLRLLFLWRPPLLRGYRGSRRRRGNVGALRKLKHVTLLNRQPSDAMLGIPRKS